MSSSEDLGEAIAADSNPPTQQKPAPASWIRRIAFVAYMVIAVVLLLEVGFRVLISEADGIETFRGIRLAPFPALSPAHRELLEKGPPANSYTAPDSELGWTIRPSSKSSHGLFFSNSQGLRTAEGAQAFSDPKPAEVTRILLIGDSYTHGDEVPWEETWAHQLQQRLGNQFEVINGAVGGYGTDQALLRGERLIKLLKPDHVVLGIYFQDIWRNLTLFRVIKHPYTQMPWSKPRYVAADEDPEGPIKLVNCPVIPASQVAAALDNWSEFELREHESMRYEPLYSRSMLDMSALYRAYRSRGVHAGQHKYRQSQLKDRSEGVTITARIAREFVQRMLRAKIEPHLLLLPGVDGVMGYREGGNPPLRFLQAELRRLKLEYADAGPFLFQAAGKIGSASDLYVKGVGHPNSRGNKAIAEAAAMLFE